MWQMFVIAVCCKIEKTSENLLQLIVKARLRFITSLILDVSSISFDAALNVARH